MGYVYVMVKVMVLNIKMYNCKHCLGQINSLDDVSSHSCFFGKSIYMENDSILFTIAEEDQSTSCQDNEINETSCSSAPNLDDADEAANKQHAVWDRNGTLGLLSLYEANMDMINHPKKKTKIWEAISNGLKEFGIQVTCDQVRWKMNALIKKYKEIVDNNSKSGRGVIEFQWFDQMDEIFGKQRNAAKQHTVSSKFPPTLSKATASKDLERKRHHEPSELASTSKCESIVSNDNNSNKRKRALHGSGSKIAKAKVELENQWLQYLRNKEENDRVKNEKYETANYNKKEALKLKKKQLTLKEAELEQKKQLSKSNAQEKQNRHAELMEIEKEKIRLLKKLLKDKDNVQNSSSESD